MTTSRRIRWTALIAASVLFAVTSNANASSSCAITKRENGSLSEVSSSVAAFGARVVAVGRVDAVSRELGVEILGLRVLPSVGDAFQVGDYAVVIDWSRRGASSAVLDVRPLATRYVPGTSEVFLKAKVTTKDSSRAQVQFGRVNVDYSGSLDSVGRQAAAVGASLVVRGTQPHPRGVILSSCISVSRDGSLGTGRSEGSLGTGRSDGSLGTGRADGSLGTGKADGSLGTGRSEGSLGTGRSDGSLGTGRADGSLGTGRAAD
jgi:hypothetical protein